MRIDVSVPGIRKERGKLPAPATLPTLRLTVPLATGPPIYGALVGPALCEPVNGSSGIPASVPVKLLIMVVDVSRRKRMLCSDLGCISGSASKKPA
jgi:hypothetical protein